jgi:ABC-type nitrate/sulfonate/bicarbonate transport system ATPase subunit
MRICSSEPARCVDLSKNFETDAGPIHALESVSFSVCANETVALLGPSGCGKSTLLLLLAGLEKPTSGRVEFRGEPLTRPHREIALVLQDYGLFPWKTVRKNIELGLKIRREPVDAKQFAGLLSELDISDKLDLYPQQLSGGQRQRVALARALILNPALLLLDEPFAALDTITRERLQDLLAAIWNSRRLGIVLVTHNIQEAVYLGQKIILMRGNPGEICEIIHNPQACDPNYRRSEAFYKTAAEVRSRLEQWS